MLRLVKYYERGTEPLEIITTRQWYIRNGGRDAALREELLARGRGLTWHPPFMRARYESWVQGLNGDWLISRQRFFWDFCDDYLELVKQRAYGEGPAAASSRAALIEALSVLLRLFAPVPPFVTEEVWSWWRDGSVHRSRWPDPAELPAGGDPTLLADTAEALRQVRKSKSQAKVSMRAPVAVAVVGGDRADRIRAAAEDLRAAGNNEVLRLEPDGSAEPSVTVALADDRG